MLHCLSKLLQTLRRVESVHSKTIPAHLPEVEIILHHGESIHSSPLVPSASVVISTNFDRRVLLLLLAFRLPSAQCFRAACTLSPACLALCTSNIIITKLHQISPFVTWPRASNPLHYSTGVIRYEYK